MTIAELAAHFGLSIDEVQRRAEQLKLPATDPYAALNPRDEAELGGSLAYTARRPASPAQGGGFGFGGQGMPAAPPPPMGYGASYPVRPSYGGPAAPAYRSGNNRAVVGIVLLVVFLLIVGGIVALLASHSSSSGGSSNQSSANGNNGTVPAYTVPLTQPYTPPVTQFTVPQFTVPQVTTPTTVAPLANSVVVGTCIFRGFESMAQYGTVNPPPVPTEPCTAPQAAYVYSAEPSYFGYSGSLDPYPDDIASQAQQECELHEDAQSEANSPTRRLLFVYPSEARWNAGDRSLICLSY